MSLSTEPAYEELFTRNIGFLTSEEQKKLRRSTIAIIGSGGDGGLVAERLVRLGIRSIRICDPEPFTVENVNRQFACDFRTLGTNKAKAVGEQLRLINPSLDLEIWDRGIDIRNLDSFISNTDLIIDESEYSLPHLAVIIGRAARAKNIPVLTGANIGLGANVFAFHPNGMTVERYYGFSEDAPIEHIAKSRPPIRAFCPWIPNYVDYNVFLAIASGEIAVPAVSQSVSAVAAVVVNEACEFLIGRRDLVYVPHYIWIDLHHRSMRIRRATKFGFYTSLLNVRLKSLFRGGENDSMVE